MFLEIAKFWKIKLQILLLALQNSTAHFVTFRPRDLGFKINSWLCFTLRDCDSQLSLIESRSIRFQLKKHVIINFDQKLLIIIWSDDSIRLKVDSIRIQWKPLNVIIDNVIIQLMWWNWQSPKSLEVKYYTKAQPLFCKCLVFARSFRPGFLNHRVAKWQRVVTDFKWVVSKQVWRSTILSSTIILIFFDNWRMGHF